MSFDPSQLTFGGSCKAFILGTPEQAQHIGKTIAALSLIRPENNAGLFSQQAGFRIIIACCDFSDLLSVKAVRRSLLRIDQPNTLKIIYYVEPQYPRMDQLLFCHGIGADYACFGKEKDNKLRSFIKTNLLSVRHESSAFSKIEASLKQAIHNRERTKISALYHKLNELGKDTSLDLIRLKISACIAMGQKQKAGVFVKQLLQQNGQDFWAIMRLIDIHDYKKSPEEAIEAISLQTDLGDTGVSHALAPGDFNCFDLLSNVEQSQIFQQFLYRYACLNSLLKKDDIALEYFSYAAAASSKNSLCKAKCLYEIGKIYFKLRKLSEAKEFFTESVNVGGDTFDQASKPLERLGSVRITTNVLKKQKTYDLSKYLLPSSKSSANTVLQAEQVEDHSHSKEKMQVHALKNSQNNCEDDSLIEIEIS